MRIDPLRFRWKSPKGFIVLDGVNGAGKSTLLAALATYLKERGTKLLLTREPGATPLGSHLRSLILEEKAGKPSPLAEVFLFAADRAEHIDKVILPGLSQGKLILSDRYVYSSIAFQGYGRELGPALVAEINRAATRGVVPDLTILLDLDPQEGLRRTRARAEQKGGASEHDAFEGEELAFHTRLRNGFLEIAEGSPEPFLILDATKSPEELLSSSIEVIDRLLESLKEDF